MQFYDITRNIIDDLRSSIAKLKLYQRDDTAATELYNRLSLKSDELNNVALDLNCIATHLLNGSSDLYIINSIKKRGDIFSKEIQSIGENIKPEYGIGAIVSDRLHSVKGMQMAVLEYFIVYMKAEQQRINNILLKNN